MIFYADDPTLLLTLKLNTCYYIFHIYIHILNTQFLNMFSWLYQSNYNTPVCHSYSCNYEKCERKFNIINDMKICKDVVTKESCYNIQRSMLDSCKLSTKTSPMSHVIVSTFGGCPFLLNKKDSLKCCNERKMLQHSKKCVRFIQNSTYIDC